MTRPLREITDEAERLYRTGALDRLTYERLRREAEVAVLAFPEILRADLLTNIDMWVPREWISWLQPDRGANLEVNMADLPFAEQVRLLALLMNVCEAEARAFVLAGREPTPDELPPLAVVSDSETALKTDRTAEIEALRIEAEALVQRRVFGSVRSAMQALAMNRGLIPNRSADSLRIFDLRPQPDDTQDQSAFLAVKRAPNAFRLTLEYLQWPRQLENQGAQQCPCSIRGEFVETLVWVLGCAMPELQAQQIAAIRELVHFRLTVDSSA